MGAVPKNNLKNWIHVEYIEGEVNPANNQHQSDKQQK
jgi:hypothetical protein